MRKFHGLIFLGSGNPNDRELIDERYRMLNKFRRLVQTKKDNLSPSFVDVEAIFHRLDEGLEFLSAQQQGDPSCGAEIEDVVCDLAAALLGREVTFGDELKYPPKHESIDVLLSDRYFKEM